MGRGVHITDGADYAIGHIPLIDGEASQIIGMPSYISLVFAMFGSRWDTMYPSPEACQKALIHPYAPPFTRRFHPEILIVHDDLQHPQLTYSRASMTLLSAKNRTLPHNSAWEAVLYPSLRFLGFKGKCVLFPSPPSKGLPSSEAPREAVHPALLITVCIQGYYRCKHFARACSSAFLSIPSCTAAAPHCTCKHILQKLICRSP